MINAGADFAIQSKGGWHILHMAAGRRLNAIIETMIQMGFNNINACGPYDTTALMLAAEKGFEDTVKLLLTARADKNKVNSAGYSALMIAAEQGNVNVVQTLIDHHADLEIVGVKPLTALELAIEEHGNDKPELATEIANKLIAAGANVHTQDWRDWYTLHLAANAGLDETILAMLKKGIPNVDTLGQKNTTPLMSTAKRTPKYSKTFIVSRSRSK